MVKSSAPGVLRNIHPGFYRWPDADEKPEGNVVALKVKEAVWRSYKKAMVVVGRKFNGDTRGILDGLTGKPQGF